MEVGREIQYLKAGKVDRREVKLVKRLDEVGSGWRVAEGEEGGEREVAFDRSCRTEFFFEDLEPIS